MGAMSRSEDFATGATEHRWVKGGTCQWGDPSEVSHTEHGEYHVYKVNGPGRHWGVDYPDKDYAVVDTKAEARANADIDLRHRNERKARQGGS